MSQFSVSVRGHKKIARELGEVMDPVRDGVKDLIEFMEEEAEGFAKPHPGDTGKLAQAVKSELAPPGRPPGGKVFLATGRGSGSASGLARTIEEGRRPGGKMPPVRGVKRWMRGHGMRGNPFRLARAMQQKGTEGVKFMERAAEKGEKEARRILKDVAAEIERKWG